MTAMDRESRTRDCADGLFFATPDVRQLILENGLKSDDAAKLTLPDECAEMGRVGDD